MSPTYWNLFIVLSAYQVVFCMLPFPLHSPQFILAHVLLTFKNITRETGIVDYDN